MTNHAAELTRERMLAWQAPERRVTAILLALTALVGNVANASPFIAATRATWSGTATVASADAFAVLLSAVSAGTIPLAAVALGLALFSKTRVHTAAEIGGFTLVSAFVLGSFI